MGLALDELIDLALDLQMGKPHGGVAPNGEVWVAVTLPSRGYVEWWGPTAEHAAQRLIDAEFPGLIDPGENDEPMISTSIKDQIARIQAGDLDEAVRYVRNLNVNRVSDLVASVFPLFDPEPWQFDVCADAIHAVRDERV